MKSISLLQVAREGDVESVRAYLHANPNCIGWKNLQTGQLPLHELLSWWASLPAVKQAYHVSRDIVALMLRQYPQSLFEVDAQGNTALHIVVKIDDRHGLDVFLLLYNGAKCMCTLRNNEGMLPIHEAIMYRQHDYVKHFIQQDYCKMNVQVLGLLNLVIGCNVRSDVIIELLRVRSECATYVDKEGLLPILYALSDGRISAAVIRALVQAYPGSLRFKNRDGRLPLHVAAAYYQGLDPGDRVRILNHVGAGFPMAFSAEDKHGELPLHWAVRFESQATSQTKLSIRALQSITLGYPQAHQSPNFCGNLPLHLACLGSQSSSTLLSFLVDQNPTGVRTVNYNGCLPLHLAARSNLPLAAVDYLIGCFPQAILKQDCDGNLPLHHAIGFRQRDLVECVQLLVQHGSESLRHANLRGACPWHVALSNHSPQAVLDIVWEEDPKEKMRPPDEWSEFTAGEKDSQKQTSMFLLCNDELFETEYVGRSA